MLAVKNLIRHNAQKHDHAARRAVSVALSFSLTTFAEGLRGQVDDLLACQPRGPCGPAA
jgi:hypothetical protein